MRQSRKNLIPDISLCACLTVCLTAAVYSGFEPGHGAGLIVAVAAITALLVFLLCRTRPGIAVLSIVGTVICAGASFLQFPIPLWSFILFLTTAAFMFFFRVYTVSARSAELGTAPHGAYLRQTAVLCISALALAGGIYLGVVRPIAPPTMELKLITVLKSMDTLEVLGISSTQTILDPEEKSAELPDELETTREQSEVPPDLSDTQRDTPPPDETREQDAGSALQQLWEAVSYDGQMYSLLWLLLLIPASIICAYVLRGAFRRRWRRRVQALSPESAVVNYYRFFLKRLGRMGIKKPGHSTLREFAENNAFALQAFASPDGGFGELTVIYEAVLYGRRSVEEAEYRRFEAFYDGFYPALRRELGPVRYYLRAFRY